MARELCGKPGTGACSAGWPARSCCARSRETYPRGVLRRDRLQRRREARPPAPAHPRPPWRGIMVEPVPYVFERLQAQLRRPRPRHARERAIADRDGELPFYHLREAEPEERPCRTGTTRSARSRASRCCATPRTSPTSRSALVATEVPALTFDSLLARHGDAAVDLAAARHRGLRLGDPAQHRPRARAARGWSSTSTTTSPPTDAARRRAHLRGARLRDAGGGLRHVLPATPASTTTLTRRWRAPEPAVPGVSIHDEPTAVSTLHLACAARSDYVPARRRDAALGARCTRGTPTLRVHFLHGRRRRRGATAPHGDGRGARRRASRSSRSPPSRWRACARPGDFMPASHWYRIFLPELLPGVDRVLYLDVDTLALRLARAALGDRPGRRLPGGGHQRLPARTTSHRPAQLGLADPRPTSTAACC